MKKKLKSVCSLSTPNSEHFNQQQEDQVKEVNKIIQNHNKSEAYPKDDASYFDVAHYQMSDHWD